MNIHRPYRIHALALGLVLTSPFSALAQNNEDGATRVEEMTITATRMPRSSDEIAGTVSLISGEQMQRQLADDLDDVTRYQPGLGMETAGRGGNQGFTIRGIGGNRVLTVIDGVRSGDMYSAGPSSYGKDMFEVDDLKAVEVIRGPASVLYGADAMGGAVVLRTRDPRDYVDGETGSHLGLRGSSASDRNQHKAGLTWAVQGETLGSVLQYTRREFSEQKVKGPGELNPQDGETGNWFWKTVWDAAPAHRLTLSLDYNDEVVDTQLESDPEGPVFRSLGEDESRRQRISLRHEWTLDSPLADSLETQLHYQDTDASQYTEQRRISYAFVDPRNPASFSGAEALRRSDFEFNQTTDSAMLVADKSFTVAGSRHSAVYGLSHERTRTERPRNRCDTRLDTGERSCAIRSHPTAPPEVFPNKTFPDTHTLRTGAFLQDEITLPGDRLVVIPGLRYDRYEMDPQPDSLAGGTGDISDYGGFSVTAVKEEEVSMNLGLLYSLTEQVSLFAQYAEGFRPPNFDESNQAFVNLGHGYATVPNPRLRAESSHGLEAGIRGSFRNLRVSLTAYNNRYEDFIESRVIGIENGIQLFQDSNVGEARIHGAEATVNWYFAEQWTWRNSLSVSRGEDEVSGSPLDSIDPPTLVSGLRYTAADERWALEGIARLVGDKDRVSGPDRVQGEAYGVLDLLGHFDITPQARLRFGVFNVLDEQYAQWGRISGLAEEDSQNIADAQAPGTNLRVGLSYEF